MKKTILSFMGLIAASGVAFAQGYVNWGASPASNVIGVTNTTAYSPFLGGGATGSGATGVTPTGSTSLFYYTLLVNQSGTATTAPTTLAGFSSWTAPGYYMTNGTVANGRLTPAPAVTSAAVPYSGSGSENFMLVGWSANLGSTWATAYANVSNWATAQGSIAGAAFWGVSTVATLAPSTSSLSPTPIFGNGLIYNPIASPLNLYLLPVPEPSTIALAGLGGLAMLALRRRK